MFDAYPTSIRIDFFHSHDVLYNKELKFIIKKLLLGIEWHRSNRGEQIVLIYS